MNLQEATFGAGCFWCVEACFQELTGVQKVQSGYSGGNIKNPAYREICTGRTGHAEVIRIEYDADLIDFEQLLEVFWFVHNPTTLNRQGNDVGTQYRSVVFYHNEEQKTLAEEYKLKLDSSNAWEDPIVTEISPLINFYNAEETHDDYLARNPDNPYCMAVVRPKYEKFKKVFADRLK